MVLIIDDEKDIRNLLAKTLQYEGYEVETAEKGKFGLSALAEKDFLVVISDIKLPDISGIELTQIIKEKYPATEIICLTAYGNIHDGVQAIKNGAFDYLVKGDDNHKIIPLLQKAFEKATLQYKIKHLEDKVQQKYSFEQVIGKSAVIQEATSLAKKVSISSSTVLLTGPTGTGKEVFAQAIHANSPRKREAFVSVNCAAFGRDILESELFGHKAGAFTGAIKDKKGLFEEAHKGTIFLDEIGELNLDLQSKLLRVLESGTFIKVGDTKETKVDVRIIAATNRNLEDEIKNSQFREDLYYRLSVFQIVLPSLNERKEDISLLAEHFAQQFAAKNNKRITGISAEYAQALKNHGWKGNIRELRNVIERSVILSESDQLSVDVLPFDFNQSKIHHYPANLSLKAMEKEHITRVINQTKGNKTKAADILGIGIATLYRKMDEYGIE